MKATQHIAELCNLTIQDTPSSDSGPSSHLQYFPHNNLQRVYIQWGADNFIRHTFCYCFVLQVHLVQQTNLIPCPIYMTYPSSVSMTSSPRILFSFHYASLQITFKNKHRQPPTDTNSRRDFTMFSPQKYFQFRMSIIQASSFQGPQLVHSSKRINVFTDATSFQPVLSWTHLGDLCRNRNTRREFVKHLVLSA